MTTSLTHLDWRALCSWTKLLEQTRLRKRAWIESVNDQLRQICPIEPLRQLRRFNFWVNRLAGVIAASYPPKQLALTLNEPGFHALPLTIA